MAILSARHPHGDPTLTPRTPSGLVHFYARSARALWTEYAPNQALRFLLRTLVWPRLTYRWCRFIAGSGLVAGNWAFAAGLLEKPHRPYMNARWSRQQRLRALIAHYEIVPRLPLGDAAQQAHIHKLVLTRFQASGNGYRLVLGGTGHSREGELELELQTDDGLRVTTILFSFVAADPALTVAIGCLQGGPADAHPHIAAVSKAFHGIPVKLLIARLLRHLLSQLSGDRGIAHLVAVDDAAQIFQHHRYRAKRKVNVSYAATWEALGGQPRGDGFWEIPMAESPPDYSSIKSSKRSAARHRREAVLAMYAAMEASLRSHRCDTHAPRSEATPDHGQNHPTTADG